MWNRRQLMLLGLVILTPVTGQFKKVLTNEDLMVLAKSGAGESDLLQAIEGNEVRFDTSAAALLTLKDAGLSEGVILAMLSAAGRSVAESVASPQADAAPVAVGVYHVRGDQRVPISPEAFKWKEEFLGSASKPGWLSRLDKIASRIPSNQKKEEDDEFFVHPIQERLNGTVLGTDSQQVVAPACEFVIVCQERQVPQEYRLVRLERKSKQRDFAVYLFYLQDNVFRFRPVPETGVLFGWHGGHPDRMIDFEAEKVSAQTYNVELPELKKGHYGFLAPGMPEAGADGKIYTFEVR